MPAFTVTTAYTIKALVRLKFLEFYCGYAAEPPIQFSKIQHFCFAKFKYITRPKLSPNCFLKLTQYVNLRTAVLAEMDEH